MAATAFFGQFKNNTDNLYIYCQYYSHVTNDGIVLGLRRYRFFSKFVFYCKLLYNIDIDQFIVVVDRPIYNANLLNLLSCLDMLTVFGYVDCLYDELYVQMLMMVLTTALEALSLCSRAVRF